MEQMTRDTYAMANQAKYFEQGYDQNENDDYSNFMNEEGLSRVWEEDDME